MLNLSGVGLSFGDFDLFSGISVSVPNDGKIGLVGPNGIGKTTLLKIIAGEDESSTGSIRMARGTRLGYLRQEAMQAFKGQANTLHEEMLTVFDRLRQQEAQLQAFEQRMAADELSEDEFTTYSEMQTHFESAGGYDYDIRIKQVLTGLGFRAEHFDLPLEVLSGGQKTRALLGRLLLEKPDLLILDEPTNHLDIDAVEWLEGMLKIWEGAIIIVSHDRYFLDRVVTNIWELSREGIEAYRGNYSHYVTQREERWTQRQAQYDMVVARFLKELDYIKRNIARDSTKNQAVGRLKRLTREVKMAKTGNLTQIANNVQWSRMEGVGDLDSSRWEVPDVEAAIKSLPRPSGSMHQMKMSLSPKRRSGDLVLRTYDVEIGFPGHTLYKMEDVELRRKERAALLGGNGTGKTTFLKTLLGRMQPLAGEIKPGASLDIGYFAQAHDELEQSRTVLDEMIEQSGMLIPEARSWLGRFLFRGEDVYKPITLLSGGERGRLALAILALEDANLLLMDEPTNHLDIQSQEVLQDALVNYDGTVLMVSHDRYLVDQLATQIWDVRDGRLTVYKMPYQEYVATRHGKAAVKPTKKVVAKAAEPEKRPTLSKNEIARRERQMNEVELMIVEAEERMEGCAAELVAAGQSGDYKRAENANKRYAAAEAAVQKLMTQWENLATELESTA